MKIKILHVALFMVLLLTCSNIGYRTARQSSYGEDYIKATSKGSEFLFNQKEYLLALKGIMPDGRHFLFVRGSILDDSMGSTQGLTLGIYSQKEIPNVFYYIKVFVDYPFFRGLYIASLQILESFNNIRAP